MDKLSFQFIGTIRTPYLDSAPYQPVDSDDQEFYLELEPEYTAGLKDLDSFTYIYVLYFIDRLNTAPKMEVSPPWIAGQQVGLFASRSPVRPNPIGLSVVRVKKVIGNRGWMFLMALRCSISSPILTISTVSVMQITVGFKLLMRTSTWHCIFRGFRMIIEPGICRRGAACCTLIVPISRRGEPCVRPDCQI